MEAKKEGFVKKPEKELNRPDDTLVATKPKVTSKVTKRRTTATGDILLSRYMLMREIGRGGTSRVYRARDLLAVLSGDVEESDIAVKVVSLPNKANRKQNSQLSMHEALTTRHLSHPNLIKIFDYHKHDDVVFVTMELVEGESLGELAHKYPKKIIPYQRITKILGKVVVGIRYAHKNGVIHSDIKPNNILLTIDGTVKVIDFATARPVATSNSKRNPTSALYGYTEAYASPRLKRDESPCVGDDIYSLACVIYELLAGTKVNSNGKSTDTTHIGRAAGANVISSDNKSENQLKIKKPKQINFLQWALLKSAFSEKGSQRFRSINQFWSLFTAARYFYRTVPALLIISLATFTLMNTVEWHPKEADPNIIANSFDLTKELENLARLALNDKLTILESPERIASLTISDQAPVSAVKSLLMPSVVNDINAETENLLAYDTSDYSAPPFDQAFRLNQRGITIYPDSKQLDRNIKSITNDKDQYINYLVLEYDRIWQLNQYDIDTARTINTILQSLKELDYSSPSVSNLSAIENVTRAMHTAIQLENFLDYYQLHSFLEILSELPYSQLALNHFDDKYMQSARALLQYTNQDSDYPNAAAKTWSSNQLDELNQLISEANTPSDLFDVNDQYDDLLNKLNAEYTNSFVQQTTTLLIDKYSNLLETNNNIASELKFQITERLEVLTLDSTAQ